MSREKDRKDPNEEDLFVQSTKAIFDESVDSLDGQAQSRLNRSRQAALAELDRSAAELNRWKQWVPAAGAAAVATVAVVLLSGNPEVDQVVNPNASQPVGDFELLMADDSFDMLLDLEFYSWVEIDAAVEGDPDTGADVG
jgi:hypothetical protein